MSRQEAFTVELAGSPASCRLDLPKLSADRRPFPVVLLCPGLPGLDPVATEFQAQITTGLVDAGMAVATPEPGAAGTRGSRLAVETIDDVAAVFHGLVVREELDLQRIGVLGHSIGAIVAACLAKRTDQIHRLCLISPTTAADLRSRLAAEPEAAVVNKLGGTAVPPGFFDGIDFLKPIEDVAARNRPTLLLHGAADRLVPPDVALAYDKAITNAGHSAELVLVAMGDHLFTSPSARTACLDVLTRFFTAPDGAGRR